MLTEPIDSPFPNFEKVNEKQVTSYDNTVLTPGGTGWRGGIALAIIHVAEWLVAIVASFAAAILLDGKQGVAVERKQMGWAVPILQVAMVIVIFTHASVAIKGERVGILITSLLLSLMIAHFSLSTVLLNTGPDLKDPENFKELTVVAFVFSSLASGMVASLLLNWVAFGDVDAKKVEKIKEFARTIPVRGERLLRSG